MSSTIGDRMVRSILERTITGEANSVKTTFSSWDNCMAKTYCKWPVIAGIIVGSLIVLGILGCLISCLCCGYQCCKGCCGCCYSCCDCGGSRHDRGASKYADSSYNNRHQPQQAPYYQQPPPPEPMNFGYRQPPPAATSSLSAAGPPPSYRGPSTATFDQPSKTAHVHVNEDELPPMPTWADAQTRRVENHDVEQHEAVEMDNLEGIRDHAKSPLHNGQQANGVAQAGPLSRGMSRGGYTEVPGTYPSPRHSPRPAYDEGYSSHGHAGGNFAAGQRGAVSRGANLGEHDAYFDQHGDQGPPYGSHAADTHYFNQSPHSPGPQSPGGYGGGYGAPVAGSAPGYAPRRSPQQSSAPYRGFENQPPPRVQVPNFSGPRAYDQSQSPRSPPAMGSGFPPYGQQQHSQQARSPPPGSAGYSPYDLHDQQSQESQLNPHQQQHQQQQQHYYDQASSGQYTPFSSRITSPPPSHSQQPPQYQATHLTGDWDPQSGNDDERPPSLLMVGRRPAPNTFRGV